MAQERKVRRRALYATTAGEVTEIGLLVSPDGRVQFVTDVVDTRVETSYQRPKGPKVIEQISLEADRLHINPEASRRAKAAGEKAKRKLDRELIALDFNFEPGVLRFHGPVIVTDLGISGAHHEALEKARPGHSSPSAVSVPRHRRYDDRQA